MKPVAPVPELQSYLQHNLHVYLDLLHQMVAVNSFTMNQRGVNRLGQLTADLFAPLGFQSEFVPSGGFSYGRHLVLTREGGATNGQPAPALGLISHLDTVYSATEEQANDFHFRIAGDRIYGPGTADIKGGTVLIYMVLDGLRHFFPDVFNGVTWRVLLNAAEEVLAPDFGALCRERLAGALAALVFESGDVDDGHYQLVTARKGMARYHITVAGRSAHAGATHHQGANAIVQLADIVSQIADFTDYERDLTFNVGTIVGGTLVNRVPHQASASVEMRAFDPAVFDEGVARMLAFNDYCSVRSAADGYPCAVQVSLDGRWEPWPANGATEGLLAVWQGVATELGATIAPRATGGLSDGNWLWDRVPTIDGLGPAGAHEHSAERSDDGSKDQEYALASSFVPKAVLNTIAIARLVESGGL